MMLQETSIPNFTRNSVMRTSTGWQIKFFETDKLLPHEEISQMHANMLYHQIASARIFTVPVIVDTQDRILLDGHHRFWCLKELFRVCLIPAVEVSYDDSEVITVESWRPDTPIDRKTVRQAALSGRLLPKKTSRHQLTHPVGKISIPLNFLEVAA